MKVAISTDQGYVSAHFGRCPSYTIVEISEGQVLNREEISNPGHQPGFLPRYLSDKGVNCIIAGGMGPRAQQLFAQNNVETIIGVQGSVDDVIEHFLNQELEPGEDLCDHEMHHTGHQGCRESQASTERSASMICITSRGPDLDSEIDPNFGRAGYLLFVDPTSMKFEAVENPFRQAAQGAGIQTAQLVAGKKADTLITGECGPNAQRVLQASSIRIVSGVEGKAKDVLSQLIKEEAL